jgi:Tol biopolymer transport system component
VPAERQQQRRRADQAETARAPLERALLVGAGVVAAVMALAGAWWLWSQTGVGAVVHDGWPNWSPDGHVLFTSEVDGQTDLYLSDRSGADRRQLTFTPGADESGGTYSPDGQLIAFQTNRDGNSEIYVMRANGEAARRLTDDPGADQAPAWSRNSRQIAFMSNRANTGFDIYRMNADGAGLERLTTGGANGYPQYSPDGMQLALHIDHDVYVMSLSTRGLRRVTREPADGMFPSWSRDGSSLAFASRRNGRSEILTAKPDGSEATVLVTMPAGDATVPRWSPDGRHIAFVHLPAGPSGTGPRGLLGIVYVVEVASGTLTRVSR